MLFRFPILIWCKRGSAKSWCGLLGDCRILYDTAQHIHHREWQTQATKEPLHLLAIAELADWMDTVMFIATY